MISLTGTTFMVAVAVAAVAAVVATLILWSKTRGPVWVRMIQRLVLVVVCQVVAVGLVGTWVNNHYGLYSSWTDLLGTTSSAQLDMTGPPPQSAKFTPAKWGMEKTYFRGPRSGLASQVYVWLPPQYEQRAYQNTAFPVVMLLHGVPGHPEGWMTVGGMPRRVASYIARGRMHPVVLVVPSIDPGGVNSDCSNTPQSRVATWLAQDVPDLIERHFKVERSPRAWALAGVSTGGLCALKLPMQYPEVFGAGAAMSPDPVGGDSTVLSNARERVTNSPLKLARKRPNVHLWAGTGAQDPNSPPSNIDALRAAIRRPTSLAPTVVIKDGGHNFRIWGQLEPFLFAWINTVQAPPGPDRNGAQPQRLASTVTGASCWSSGSADGVGSSLEPPGSKRCGRGPG